MLEKLVLASIITFALNFLSGGHVTTNQPLSKQAQLTATPVQMPHTLTAQAESHR